MYLYVLPTPHLRHLCFCGALATRRASLPQVPATLINTPSRSFINLAAPITTRRMEYTESQTLE